jgi:hypothetical protein
MTVACGNSSTRRGISGKKVHAWLSSRKVTRMGRGGDLNKS